MPRELAERIRERWPDVLVARDEATVVVDRDELLEALTTFRDDAELDMSFCSSVTAVDRPGEDPRFWIAYEMRSLRHSHRLRVKVGVPNDDPWVPTVTGLFPTANWHERETYDFFGVTFAGHPDLKRILLPDDWDGFPLRKDEELGGVNTRFVGAFIPPVDRRTITRP
ncbi:MAG: NADH-quinone oxidoreductase subunit C [Actinomycetota bacterium]